MADDLAPRIRQAYRDYVGTDPSPEGLKTWQGRADKDGITSAIEGIRSSPTAKMHAERTTVEGRLGNILDSDSPLMQRAETQGKQYANKRGLLNSSMGAQATQGAMIDRAMPIAQQDAGFHQDLSKMDRGHGQDMEKLYGTSQANAWGVLANNVTDVVAQSMDSINQIQSNPDISAANKQKMISQVTNMRDTDIKFQQNLYSNLSSYLKNTGVFPSL